MANLKRLDKNQLQAFVRVKAILQRAAALTGVPWQAIAAIWYRESFSVASPETPGGPFQFDPPLSQVRMRKLLTTYCPSLTPAERELLIYQGLDKFASAAVFAACWLREMSQYNLKDNHSDQAMLDAFYGYNGRAFGPNPYNSNYVVNELDLAHDDMLIRGSIPDKNNPGKRIWIKKTDLRPGAFTVYKQLLEAGI